jgi:hypothetical protein
MAASTPSPAPRAPSKRWYRLASSLVALGLLAAIAWWFYATNRVYEAVEGFQRLAPFGGDVVIEETGTHTFWVEGACLSCHDNAPSEYRAASTVAIVGPDGQRLAVRPAPARVYNTARREGRSLWLFDVTERGKHHIDFDLDTDTEGWDNTVPDNIAVGEGNGLPVGIIRPMAVMAGVSIGLAVVIAGVTMVRRRRYYGVPYDKRT